MHLPWYIAALGAAMVWGLHYPLVELALKRLSIYGTLLLTVVGIVAVAPLFYQPLAHDWQTFKMLAPRVRLALSMIPFTTLIASALLYTSIDNKNATLASLLEISYPVFVALFTSMLFHQHHFNLGVSVGALMVFGGVTLIVLSQA